MIKITEKGLKKNLYQNAIHITKEDKILATGILVNGRGLYHQENKRRLNSGDTIELWTEENALRRYTIDLNKNSNTYYLIIHNIQPTTRHPSLQT